MTNQQHPALFDWATELLDAEGHVTLSAKEAHEIGARLRSMGDKLKAYEDLDEADSDVQLLRMGYAAARLEIESLQARIKTMAEEHADELMVAHLDGMRAAQPAGAQQPGAAYAALSDAEIDRIVPALEPVSEDFPAEWAVWKDRERIRKELRASHGQAPAPATQQASQADSVTAPAEGANWQDISTAPKDGTRFVAVGNNYGLYSETQHTCIAQWFRGCWMEVSDWNEASELKYLTHWMPLPAQPASKEVRDAG